MVMVCSDLSVKITDFGAIADEKTDCTPAFYKAYANLKNQLLNNNNDRQLEGIILVPAGKLSYLINTPIMIQDPYIKVKGEGYGSRLLNVGFGPTFIFGLRTVEQTTSRQASLDPRYNPSRVGKLSIGGNGRRLCGDSSLSFHGSPFDLGPQNADGSFTRWLNNSILTIDLAIENNETSWRQHGIICLGGISSPVVFSLGRGGNQNQYDFAFTDSLGLIGRGTFLGVQGLNKISLQLNLDQDTLRVWVNGSRVQSVLNYSNTTQNVGLCKNSFDPFLVGVDVNTSDGRVPVGASGRRMPDFTIWGLSICDREKYTQDDIQHRIDNGIVDDSYRYGLDTLGVAQLYGNDIPNSRLVTAFSGKSRSRIFYGYNIQVDQFTLLGGIPGNTLEDIQLVTLVPVAPVVHTIGSIDFTARRVNFRGGSQGLSALPSLASYYTRLESCDFSAVDYSIVGSWSVIRATDTRFRQVGKGAVLTQASDIRFNGGFVAFTSPWTDTIASMFGGSYGGKYRFADLDIDMEGPTCNLAPFYVEQSPNLNTLLSLERIYLGSAANGRPVVISKKAIGGGAWPYKIDLQDIDSINGTPSTPIDTRLP